MLIIELLIFFCSSRMALSTDDIRMAAQRLHQAEKTRQQIRQQSLDFPGMTIEDAYAIQTAWIGIKRAEGRKIKGHKIGLTSKAMQSALNIDEPNSGVLLNDMFFADGGLVPSERFIATRVEAELAFVMGNRLCGPAAASRRPALDRRAVLSERPIGKKGLRACSIIPRPPSPGLPTRSYHFRLRSSLLRWSWPDRSSARSRPARATQ
jgi:hypothetical protein